MQLTTTQETWRELNMNGTLTRFATTCRWDDDLAIGLNDNVFFLIFGLQPLMNDIFIWLVDSTR